MLGLYEVIELATALNKWSNSILYAISKTQHTKSSDYGIEGKCYIQKLILLTFGTKRERERYKYKTNLLSRICACCNGSYTNFLI